jgi:Uma2 family endonuclease
LRVELFTISSIQSPPKISLEEFLLLPETKPASEYVDGEIYQKDLPQGVLPVLDVLSDLQLSVANLFDLLSFG